MSLQHRTPAAAAEKFSPEHQLTAYVPACSGQSKYALEVAHLGCRNAHQGFDSCRVMLLPACLQITSAFCGEASTSHKQAYSIYHSLRKELCVHC